MIPKKIHYCWFGRNPKPELARKCFESWKKFCPDYEIFEWNEDNYDIHSAPLFVRQAYEAKKWAFVTDYVRLEVVHNHGGIYLDTDVEIIKPIDDLLQYNAFFGLQSKSLINTGLGFGAEAGTLILQEMIETYKGIPFIKEDGTYDNTPCPDRDTRVFINHGFKEDNTFQILPDSIACLPTEYLSPKDYLSERLCITEDTRAIHHFAESWMSEKERTDMDEVRRSLYHPTLTERFKRWAVRKIKNK